jgi:1-pyrroline-4-hydroxy-2-carboxylate deaminase
MRCVRRADKPLHLRVPPKYPKPSKTTPERNPNPMHARTPVIKPTAYVQRRDFLQILGAGAVGLALANAGSLRAADAGAPGTAPSVPNHGPKQLRGLFPIGSTPFTQDDKLDLESLAAQVTFCNRGGVHGFVWPQIASGWTTLSEAERMAGTEAILAAGKGGATTLVVGVQSKTGDLQEVERYAKHAVTNGADAIVSLPLPGVSDEKLLLEYYQKVGRMTDLPLIVQTQDNMSVDLVVEIYKTVPTFRHVKDEAKIGGGALQRITEIRKRTNDEVKVFSGQGVRTMITEMELGFSGHCPTVDLADVYAAAFDLWHAGKRREAFDMFGRILAFNSLGTSGRESVLVARGVFKPTVQSRKAPPTPGVDIMPGAGRPPAGPHLDDKGVLDGLNNYLKPYLRA